eukprot:336512-Alexandrium_andersonii.AAC.1
MVPRWSVSGPVGVCFSGENGKPSNAKIPPTKACPDALSMASSAVPTSSKKRQRGTAPSLLANAQPSSGSH